MAILKTPTNAFPVGNQFYKLASHTGRPKLFATPDDLLSVAYNYFDFCVENPINVYEVACVPPRLVVVPKMRAMSLQGLCVYAGICNLRRYRARADFVPVIEFIQGVIFSYNIEGAAAGVLNPCIIAHILGLKKPAKIKKNLLRSCFIIHEILSVKKHFLPNSLSYLLKKSHGPHWLLLHCYLPPVNIFLHLIRQREVALYL